MVRLTRSATVSRRGKKLPLEEEIEDIARKARLQAAEERAAQEAQEALEERLLSQTLASEFEFDTESMLTDADIETQLIAHTNATLANSTLSRLQKAGDDMNPNIRFPANRVFPKVAVFLRCLDTHVFGLHKDMESLTLPGDSHAIAQIMGPCPQCVPDKATTEVFAKRKCPFCLLAMPESLSGRYLCLTDSCWLSQTNVLSGTQMATSIWKEVWRKMGNRYFFVGPWEDVLTFSNDFNRDAPETWSGGPFTV